MFKILHLEDEQSIVDLVARLLVQIEETCKIDHVAELTDFNTKLVSNKYDLVLSDFQLRGFTGMKALNIAHNYDPLLPFVFFTGSIGEERAIECLRLGATDVILKQNMDAFLPGMKNIIEAIKEKKKSARAEQLRDVVFNISIAANESKDLNGFYEAIAEELSTVLDTSNIIIGLYDAGTDRLKLPFMKDDHDQFKSVPAKNTISKIVIENKKPLIMREQEINDFIKSHNIDRVGTPAKVWLGVPLLDQDQSIGIIVVQSYTDETAFNEDDLNLLEFVGARISSIVHSNAAAHEISKLSRSVEQSPVSIVITDVDGSIEYVNPAFCAVTGYTAEEVLGENPRISKTDYYSELQYRELWETIKSGNVWKGVFQNRHKNGDYFWEEASISPVKDEAGRITNFIAIKEDITKRIKAEEELKNLHNENEQLLQSIASILIVMDAHERIIRWNKAAEEIFGVSAKQAIGNELLSIDINWDWSEITLAIFNCRTEQKPVTLKDLKFINKSGQEHYLNLNINPASKDTSTQCGFLIFGEDISEQRVLESQLHQAQKLESIGQLAAGIAHEINTPTQYVGDNVYFLNDAFNDLKSLLKIYGEVEQTIADPKLKQRITQLKEEIDIDYLLDEIPQALEQASDGIQRVSKIVRAMKEFSHPGYKSKTRIDLNNAVENTITVARNEYKYVADLETEFDPDLNSVPCMPGEFNQVILNMIINAAHAIGEKIGNSPTEKGKITIRTRKAGEMAEVSISDSGCGMVPEVREKIFDPFFTTKEVGKGTGQGLAISHNVIVNKHGGTIKVESEPGEGTTFIIQIPLEPEQEISAC